MPEVGQQGADFGGHLGESRRWSDKGEHKGGVDFDCFPPESRDEDRHSMPPPPPPTHIPSALVAYLPQLS